MQLLDQLLCYHRISTLIPIFLLPLYALALQPCPLLGPAFPAPTNLSSSPIFQSAKRNLTSLFQQAIATGNTTHGPLTYDVSFSLSIFSAHSASPLFQYSHTAPAFSNSSVGVRTVDENSIYRIGSVSKLLTVYLFLIEAGDTHWNDPITKYVPELAAAADSTASDAINCVDWASVTVGELASHMAGISREYSFGDIALAGLPFANLGLPPVSESEIPQCGIGNSIPLCSRKAFFDGFLKRSPVFLPSTTPIYSNVAFQILGYALESITGKPYSTMLEKDIINPLGLTRTSYTQPNSTSWGVIPVNETLSSWNLNVGDEGPAASIYSTASDLSTIGRAILQSTLISPAMTYRWLKPATHTTSLALSIGAPWEIHRIALPANRVVDLYTKGGAIGLYNSEFGLIPDYDVGFALLIAGETPPDQNLITLADLITDVLVQALENAAREQASLNYAGTYVSKDTALNSSITLTTDPQYPGLSVTHWVSNGTDFLSAMSSFPGTGGTLRARLYPTNLRSSSGSRSRIAFRAVLQDLGMVIDNGAFSIDCYSWTTVGNTVYALKALDEFIFDLGGDGKAVSVELSGLRVTLERA